MKSFMLLRNQGINRIYYGLLIIIDKDKYIDTNINFLYPHMV